MGEIVLRPCERCDTPSDMVYHVEDLIVCRHCAYEMDEIAHENEWDEYWKRIREDGNDGLSDMPKM